MNRQFFRVKFATLDQELAINVLHIRAVLPVKEGKYHIWLDTDLNISSEIGKRVAKLGGVLPVSKDCWEVQSTDLSELFK